MDEPNGREKALLSVKTNQRCRVNCNKLELFLFRYNRTFDLWHVFAATRFRTFTIYYKNVFFYVFKPTFLSILFKFITSFT